MVHNCGTISEIKYDNLFSDKITISPNPLTSQTSITFSEIQKNCTIKIMDVLGKKIKEINFAGKELIIEKGAMKEGIYFLLIQNEKRNVAIKKIVIH
jgi:hypothetical protein